MEKRYWKDIADDQGLEWETTEMILSSREIEEFMRKGWRSRCRNAERAISAVQ